MKNPTEYNSNFCLRSGTEDNNIKLNKCCALTWGAHDIDISKNKDEDISTHKKKININVCFC